MFRGQTRNAKLEAQQNQLEAHHTNHANGESHLPVAHRSGYYQPPFQQQQNGYSSANASQASQNWGQWGGAGGQIPNQWGVPNFTNWNPMMNNHAYSSQMSFAPRPVDPNGFNGAMSAMLHASLAPNLAPPQPPQLPPGTETQQPHEAAIDSPMRTTPKKNSAENRDAIRVPSAASGGVPEPTEAYTMRASFTPIRQPQPGPLLVVIDLNGTLLHRPDRKKAFQFVPRPHAHKFIGYCVDTFWVVIWSSARPDNVRKMCANLLSPEQLQRVVAVWGRDRFGLTSDDYNRRVQCYKRLTLLWDNSVVKASHPGGGVWNQGNTVLIDDSFEKARSEPHNLIQIPEFVGVDETTDILPQVHDYLNELCFQSDVSTYIRASPFKEQEIPQ